MFVSARILILALAAAAALAAGAVLSLTMTLALSEKTGHRAVVYESGTLDEIALLCRCPVTKAGVTYVFPNERDLTAELNNSEERILIAFFSSLQLDASLNRAETTQRASEAQNASSLEVLRYNDAHFTLEATCFVARSTWPTGRLLLPLVPHLPPPPPWYSDRQRLVERVSFEPHARENVDRIVTTVSGENEARCVVCVRALRFRGALRLTNSAGKSGFFRSASPWTMLRPPPPLVVAFFVCTLLPSIEGHGRLIEPPSRASAWRYGFETPPNYNDHELYCGGFTRQWVRNEGRCGVCGDPWDTKSPRPHEYGGTYGQGVIVRKYNVGQLMTVRVELTASHMGYFQFAVCPNYKNTSQACLDKNLLRLARPQEDAEHAGAVRYFPRKGNEVYDMKYRLPKMTCEHCVLQWRYIAGNNWGNCPNGTGAVGCGPQEEFRACADITIQGKGPAMDYPEQEENDAAAATTVTPTDSPEATYNPIGSLVTSIVSFLVVSLVLFLLYFHYYQLGRQIKAWMSRERGKGGGDVAPPPLPPPRTKRNRRGSVGCDSMHEISLK